MQMVGTGTRVLNFLIDTLIVAALSRALYTWYSFQVMYWHYPFVRPYVFLAVVLVLYYFIFESIFKRTPAKWLTLTKVVTKDGGRPNVLQILVRSLVRLIPIDCFFIPFLDGRTLHDYLSKTYIVEV